MYILSRKQEIDIRQKQINECIHRFMIKICDKHLIGSLALL